MFTPSPQAARGLHQIGSEAAAPLSPWHNFPARQSTHDALDHFLVKAALAAADTQIGAARLLGEAKGNFNKLVRRYGPDR